MMEFSQLSGAKNSHLYGESVYMIILLYFLWKTEFSGEEKTHKSIHCQLDLNSDGDFTACGKDYTVNKAQS